MASLPSISCSHIFNRAFIFEGPSSLNSTDENASLCASVGLYNMALAAHSEGLTRGGPSCLVAASGLYRKAFSILQALAPLPTNSVSSFLLATVLNLIACENELGGYHSTKP
eukprot:scaffold3400_cov169-Amphora_coffeaeformis.AAC.9